MSHHVSFADHSVCSHRHDYHLGQDTAERRATITMVLTLVTMVVEIAAGMMTNSMALLADGLHMSTHGAALGIAAFAYWYARHHASDGRFTFGTGKVGALGAFTSAILLVVVAVGMVVESGQRLFGRNEIAFDEALAVAVLGLGINLLSAVILGGHGHDHAHSHDHSQGHSHDHSHDSHGHEHEEDSPLHHDQNLRGAYLHVLADALTSVLAIAALVAGKYWGWNWLDPLMGIVGAVVIGVWSKGLLHDAAAILLDKNEDGDKTAAVRRALTVDGDDNRIVDLHLWRLSSRHWAAIVSVATGRPQPAEYYRQLLAAVPQLSHVTVEVVDIGTTAIPWPGQPE